MTRKKTAHKLKRPKPRTQKPMQTTNHLMDALTRSGVLITVSVRYWRATKKLNAEDIGLDPDRVTDRLISLGHKKLLPKNVLEPFALIESRAHRAVETNSFPFLNGLGHFVPNRLLTPLTEKLDGLAAEFESATREFLAHYAERRTQALEEWREVATKLVRDPEHLVATIDASFPAVGKMQRHFGFATQLFQIRAPEHVQLDLTNAVEQESLQQARDDAARKATKQIETGVQQFMTDTVATLREQTAQLCHEMLETIRTGKSGVHQRTLNRLTSFIDQFKQLNFMGDFELEAMLNRTRSELLTRSAEEYRDNTVARTQLQNGLSALADTARQLATQDARDVVERFGQLGQRRLHLAI